MTVEAEDSRDDAELRIGLRHWLRENAPDPNSLPERGSADFVEASRAFTRRLFEAGWAGLSWPAEYGGRGMGAGAEQIFREEASKYSLPTGVYDIGFGMCGPTILHFGTETQLRRYILKMLSGEEIWCQLFSEPGAGSDVAGARTRAVADGDGWIINGQKVWTSGAHYSRFGILLARTNPDVPKHRGLTMFIVDMAAPGVTVRPLRDMAGQDHFNEVFFDDVALPPDAVVGSVDDGWTVARFLLNQERLAATAGAGTDRYALNPMSFTGMSERARAAGRLDVPGLREELLDLYLAERALESFNERIAQETELGYEPGPRGSIGKLLKAQHDQRAADVAGRVLGPEFIATFQAAGDDVAHSVLTSPVLAIGGGTNEIQLNIIGERVLRLPPEPRSDLELSFRDLERKRVS